MKSTKEEILNTTPTLSLNEFTAYTEDALKVCFEAVVQRETNVISLCFPSGKEFIVTISEK